MCLYVNITYKFKNSSIAGFDFEGVNVGRAYLSLTATTVTENIYVGLKDGNLAIWTKDRYNRKTYHEGTTLYVDTTTGKLEEGNLVINREPLAYEVYTKAIGDEYTEYGLKFFISSNSEKRHTNLMLMLMII